MITRNQTLRAGLVLGFTLFAAERSFAQKQITFSVDWQGPMVGQADTTYAFPITEGDTLLPAAGVPMFGPLMIPGNGVSAGVIPNVGLGLWGHMPCAGHPGGSPCIVEVDALSYGNEPKTGPGAPLMNNLAFSVDRQARGAFSTAFPDVMSEALVGDAAGDMFIDLGLGVGPLAPFTAITPGNIGVVDGDGMVSGSGAVYKGIGLAEPSCATCLPPNTGDNLDAFATRAGSATFPVGGVYFSLDDNFVDPMLGVFNTGSAQAHGFFGGDVLYSATPGGPPVLYAAAGQLGLNLTGNLDDLDALILHENGTPGYQPSLTPNDWMGGATDMLLFSVRRGSFLIGRPDSIFGIPITEGDVLTTPLFGSPNPNPGIYIAAENLGLAGRVAGLVNDDLDALDLLSGPINDCNGNGVDDAIDISTASSWDINANGVPDECEALTRGFCYCAIPSVAPCANFYPPGGCLNSGGVGAIMSATGTTSVTNDNLVLTTVQVPPNKPGQLLMSKNTNGGVPFMDGILCLKNPQIFRFAAQNSGGSGTFTYGPGLVSYCFGNFGPPGWIFSGSTWNFQMWYRDPFGPCGQGSNVSNAIQAQFTP
ncbi:MAG TPA: hypothetical protein VK843_17205 [Planctomycetota bacterium]|nr:hypothetical protein [Planctomycetota bacterium]